MLLLLLLLGWVARLLRVRHGPRLSLSLPLPLSVLSLGWMALRVRVSRPSILHHPLLLPLSLHRHLVP